VTLQADLALDNGANPISADHNVGFCSRSIRKGKMDPISFFLDLDAAMTERDGPFRERIRKEIQ
jgi:hypothetical protein